jgi:hypothetical protein
MSVHALQIKARDEWYGSMKLRREYRTPEYYWSMRYERVYCPGYRAEPGLWTPRTAAP